jgi:hypothetical protein
LIPAISSNIRTLKGSIFGQTFFNHFRQLFRSVSWKTTFPFVFQRLSPFFQLLCHWNTLFSIFSVNRTRFETFYTFL